MNKRNLADVARILIVDDEAALLRSIALQLSRSGHECRCVETIAAAGSELERFEPELAIVDIRLPDMTGFECIYQLREIHEHLSIILMTGFGYDPTHSIVKARQHGLKSVLYKPFRLDQLLNEVEKAVTTEPDLAETPK